MSCQGAALRTIAIYWKVVDHRRSMIAQGPIDNGPRNLFYVYMACLKANPVDFQKFMIGTSVSDVLTGLIHAEMMTGTCWKLEPVTSTHCDKRILYPTNICLCNKTPDGRNKQVHCLNEVKEPEKFQNFDGAKIGF